MKITLPSLAILGLAATSVVAQIKEQGQCGGGNYNGTDICVEGTYCTLVRDDYFECLSLSPALSYSVIATLPVSWLTWLPPVTRTPIATSSHCTATPFTTTIPVYNTITEVLYTVATVTQTSTVTIPTTYTLTTTAQTCISTTTAKPTSTLNSTYITTKPPPTSTYNTTSYITPPPTTRINSTQILSSTTSIPPCPTTKPGQGAGNFTYKGFNIAGFEFGCYDDGSCPGPNDPPLPGYGTGDGPGQMSWFLSSGRINTFRLPVGWQYIAPGLGGFGAQFKIYDILVRTCLKYGAYCIIDVHNWGRFDGNVIGQSSVTDADFANLWQMIAAYYVSEPRVIFGLMNAPHDLNINIWANTVQVAVNAIRSTGAQQVILLPGTSYTKADEFVSSGSLAALNGVVNPDGSYTNLIFDIQQWADKPDNGTEPDCVTNNIPMFSDLANWLRCYKRQAFLTETGGGNTDSCIQDICQQMAFLQANADVYVGYTGWAAGSYDASYVLDETPVNYPPWVDTPLVANCLYW